MDTENVHDGGIAEIINQVRRLFQAVHTQSKRAQRETGTTGPQLWAMQTIARSTPVNVSELARSMYLHPATVVGILDRLEQQGFVVRRRSARDRRVVEVALTGEGQKRIAGSPEIAQHALVRGLEALPQDSLRRIAGSLDELVGILGVRNAAPEPMHSLEGDLSGEACGAPRRWRQSARPAAGKGGTA